MLEGGKEGEKGERWVREETSDRERKKGGRKERKEKRRAEGLVCTSVISYSCSHMVPGTPGQNLSVGERTCPFNC